MTHSENVREFFCNNGFEILQENACRDDGRDYICMCAQYTGKNVGKSGLYFYTGSHPIDGNEPSLRYVKKQIGRVSKRFVALTQAGINRQEAAELKKILDEAEEKGLWHQ